MKNEDSDSLESKVAELLPLTNAPDVKLQKPKDVATKFMNKYKGFNQTKVYHAVRKRIDKQRYSRDQARAFSYIKQLGDEKQRCRAAGRNLENNVKNHFSKENGQQKMTTKRP